MRGPLRTPGSSGGSEVIRHASSAVVMLLLVSGASAVDRGQYGEVPDDVRSWFKSVRSPHGIPCCDIADGHRTSFRADAAGHFWVPIGPEGDPWVLVPPEAVVTDAGNPTDSAIVWFVPQGNGPVFIRCFVPTGGV